MGRSDLSSFDMRDADELFHHGYQAAGALVARVVLDLETAQNHHRAVAA